MAMEGLGGVGGQTPRAFFALFDCFSLFYATNLTPATSSEEGCLAVFAATKTIAKGARMGL